MSGRCVGTVSGPRVKASCGHGFGPKCTYCLQTQFRAPVHILCALFAAVLVHSTPRWRLGVASSPSAMLNVDIDDSTSEPEAKRPHTSAAAGSRASPDAVAGLPAAEGPQDEPLAVASGSVEPPPKGVYWDFAVHGIRFGHEVSAVAKNALVVAFQRRDQPPVCLPGMATLAVPEQTFMKFPWVQWPVVLYSESVISVRRLHGVTFPWCGDKGDLTNVSAACPAAFVVEVKLRKEHFDNKMPSKFTIGMIIAGGRMNTDDVWKRARAEVEDCTLVFVSTRGGGANPEQQYGMLPFFARNMFKCIAIAEDDLVIYHIERLVGIQKFTGKLEAKKHPVVWMSCRHGPGGHSGRNGKGKDKGRKGKDKGHSNRGGGQAEGTASSNRGGGKADHKG